MKYNFDDYLNVVKQNIKNKKLHAPICEELESHLQEAAEFYSEIGYDDSMAKYKALEDMGPPHYVAEDLAKLHELSYGQRFSEFLFAVLVCIKIVDSLVVSLLSLGGMPAFFMAEEFTVMSVIAVSGFIMAISHKRVLPARFAVVYAIADVVATFNACGITLYGISGQWESYINAEILDLSFGEHNLLLYICSILLTVAITGVFIFTYDRIQTYVESPNFNSIGLRKLFYIIAIPAVCIILAVTVGAKTHLNKVSIEEKSDWDKVVAEFADYCLENEKITEFDIHKIVEHFDYLNFEDYSENSEHKIHLSAQIGKSSLACPHFYIYVLEDGNIETGVVNYYTQNIRSYNPFLIGRVMTDFDTTWSHLDSGYSYENNPFNRIKKGDPAEKFTDIIKKEQTMFIYKYNTESDRVSYKTHLFFDDNIAEIFFGGFKCYVTVDSGVITDVYTGD